MDLTDPQFEDSQVINFKNKNDEDSLFEKCPDL